MIARSTDLPPVWMTGFALAGAMLGKRFPLDLPCQEPVGAALCVLALLIMLGAGLQMFLARTPLIPGHDPRRLLRRGFFRFSRNPIYLADAIFLAGLFIAWGAYAALPLVPAFMWLIFKRFIQGEEARLARLFGHEFSDYRAKTRRWI